MIAQISDLFDKIKSGVPDFYMMLVDQNLVFLMRNKKSYKQVWIIKSPVNYMPNNIEEDDFITVSSRIERFSRK